MGEMHQALLRKYERESKAKKRLSMNNEELMWRLSRSDIGPLADDEDVANDDGTPASMTSSANVAAPLTGSSHRGGGIGGGAGGAGSGGRIMSKSYDSATTMAAAAAGDHRPIQPFVAMTSHRPTTTATSRGSGVGESGVRIRARPASSAAVEARLRRSGTYEVVDQPLASAGEQ